MGKILLPSTAFANLVHLPVQYSGLILIVRNTDDFTMQFDYGMP